MDLARTTTSCRFVARTVGIALSILVVAATAMAARATVPRQVLNGQIGGDGVQGMPTILPGTPTAAPEAPPDVVWTVGIAAAPITSPLIAGDVVIIAHLPGVLSAHRLSDGVQVWTVDLNPEQRFVADDSMLFVASGEAIHALRLTDGAVAWRAPAGTLTAPLLAQEGWVIAASGSKLTALRSADGSKVWTIDAPPQREGSAISGDTLFVPSTDGYVRARQLLTGKEVWRHRLRGQPGEPLVAGDSLLVAAADKAIYKLDAATGEEQWRYRVGASIRGRAASDGDRVFVTALDNMVRALDLGDGSLKWQVGLAFRPLTGPTVAGNTVFITSPTTDIQMRRATDGARAGTVTFPAKLAVPPGMRESEYGVAIAAITGGLEESWNLLATRPVRAVPAAASTGPPPK